MTENVKNRIDANVARVAAIKNTKLHELNLAYYQTLQDSLGALVALGIVRLPTGRPLRILEIGCANAEVLPAVAAFFGGSPLGEIPSNIAYTGVDIVQPDPPSFRGVTHAENLHDPHVVRFIKGDASDLRSLLGNEEQFDVVIFRTPQVQVGVGEMNIAGLYDEYAPNPAFTRLFDEGFNVLGPQGVLIASTKYGWERAMLEKVLARRGSMLLSGTSSVGAGTAQENDNYVVIAGTTASSIAARRLSQGQLFQK